MECLISAYITSVSEKNKKTVVRKKRKKPLLIHPQYHVPQLLSAQILFPPGQNIYRRSPDVCGDMVMLFLADHSWLHFPVVIRIASYCRPTRPPPTRHLVRERLDRLACANQFVWLRWAADVRAGGVHRTWLGIVYMCLCESVILFYAWGILFYTWACSEPTHWRFIFEFFSSQWFNIYFRLPSFETMSHGRRNQAYKDLIDRLEKVLIIYCSGLGGRKIFSENNFGNLIRFEITV